MNATLDKTFSALSDSTRRTILVRLADGPASVNELAKPFHVSQQAISKHVAVLVRAGLVRQTKSGRLRQCELEPEPFEYALHWMAQHREMWEACFERLQAHLKRQQQNKARDT